MQTHGYKTTNVLSYEVFSASLDIIRSDVRKVLINTFSPNSYGLALRDRDFEKALKGADLLVLDGIGIALGSLLLNGKNIKKIAGQDCFDYLMDLSNQHQWRVFLLGSSPRTLEKITERMGKEYPRVTVSGYSPPFKAEFSQEDNELMVQTINSFQPDVLFIAMTAPKQEKWGYQHRDLVNARVLCAVGNVFDWYAGNSKRPAPIWVKLRLEWLVRIFLRPEIFRRNTANQLAFLKDLFLHITYLKRIKN